MEVPDEDLPRLDRVLFRWTMPGVPPDLTLLNSLLHGVEAMDTPDPPPWQPPDEKIPF